MSNEERVERLERAWLDGKGDGDSYRYEGPGTYETAEETAAYHQGFSGDPLTMTWYPDGREV